MGKTLPGDPVLLASPALWFSPFHLLYEKEVSHPLSSGLQAAELGKVGVSVFSSVATLPRILEQKAF